MGAHSWILMTRGQWGKTFLCDGTGGNTVVDLLTNVNLIDLSLNSLFIDRYQLTLQRSMQRNQDSL